MPDDVLYSYLIAARSFIANMAPGQQWLFRHSSPVQKDVVTRVVISDPHGYNSVGSAADAAVPLILRPFVPAANQ